MTLNNAIAGQVNILQSSYNEAGPRQPKAVLTLTAQVIS